MESKQEVRSWLPTYQVLVGENEYSSKRLDISFFADACPKVCFKNIVYKWLVLGCHLFPSNQLTNVAAKSIRYCAKQECCTMHMLYFF